MKGADMSGGVLVVVDKRGRVGRRLPLTQGLATLGRDPDNDIRILLPDVAPHHATVLIHDAQAVIRSTGGGVTLLNGRAVSVAPLQHGDQISIGGRALRWEYSHPRPASAVLPGAQLALVRRAAGRPRRSTPAAGSARDRVLVARDAAHRASMPSSTGGKQVAIVQPQRRDASDVTEKTPARNSPLTTRRAYYEASTSETEQTTRKSYRASPKSFLQTTKATQWIESRKSSPRKRVQSSPPVRSSRRSLPSKRSTPLRLTVLKRAQSAHKPRVIKIEAPSKIDHTKQAALLLMTGHTPRSKLHITPKSNSTKKSPSYIIKKQSPVHKTPRGRKSQGRASKSVGSVTPADNKSKRSSKRSAGDRSVTILEISDSTQNSTGRSGRSSRRSTQSPVLPTPKKSALKDRSKKSFRKTESIKFDLSNLESHRDDSMESSRYETDEEITLRYSESPSPRRSIHSRSQRMLAELGVAPPLSPARSPARSLVEHSPSARRSFRGNAMVEKALENSADRTKADFSINNISSDRTRSDLSTLVASDRTKSGLSNVSAASDRTRADLSVSAPDRTRSRLSANSLASDRTRSDLSAAIATDRTRSRLSATTNASDRTRSDLSSLIAPERTRSRLSANSVASDRTRSDLSSVSVGLDRKSRGTSASLASAFRTRTLSPRHNLESYSVVDLVSFDSDDTSKSIYDSANSNFSRLTRSTLPASSSTPYVSRGRVARDSSSVSSRRSVVSTRRSKSLTTPENGEPVAPPPRPSRASRSRSRIHDDLSLLDLSEPGESPRTSKRSRAHDASATGDEGTTTPENTTVPLEEGTPVLNIRSLLDSSRVSNPPSARRSPGPRRSRLRLTREPSPLVDLPPGTPTTAAPPSPEHLKNKHSTAKKPQSKRSIIDDLDRSDIVKQLFDSPVKRKLAQSMTEFSKKRLFDEDEEEIREKKPTRRTLATGESAPSLLTTTIASGSSRRGKKRQSTKNDLTDVRGVKAVFGKQPKNDYRRVTGVSSLFRQKSPKNDLTDMRGVRHLFLQKSPTNDLRNVSGVKRTLRASPVNDLCDVRGVRQLFREKKRESNYRDISGIEELYRSREADTSEVLFDELVGRPPVRAVYSRTLPSTSRSAKTSRQSLRTADLDTDRWLEQELRKLPAESSYSRRVTAELKKLATDTVEGAEPVVTRKTRHSSVKSSPRYVASPKGTPKSKGSPKTKSPISKRSSLSQGSPISKRSSVNKVSPASKRSSVIQGSPINKRSSQSKASPKAKGSPISKRSSIGKIPQAKRSPGNKGSPPRRPAQRAVHSTPLKGRLQLTMNASELGRVSPIAGPSQLERYCYVSISTQTTDEMKNMKTKSPRKQKTPVKIEITITKPKSPEKPSRATRNKKVTETVSNTKKRRSSLVVTKKTPAMTPKGVPKSIVESEKESPKKGTSRTRARAQAALVVPKPSPKMKPRGAKPTEEKHPQTSPQPTRKRKAAEKKPESPKASPKGKRKTRADKNASKIDSPVKAKKTKIEPAPVEQPQTKRARRGKAEESNEVSKTEAVKQTRRGKAAAAKPEVEEKQPRGRGKKAQNQTSIQSEPEEVEPKKRGKGAQNKSSVEAVAAEEKRSSRGRKTQIAEPVEEKKSSTRGKKVQNQTAELEIVQTKRSSRGKTAQTSTEAVENKPNRRGKNVHFETNVQTETTTRRGRKTKVDSEPKTVGNKVQSPVKEKQTRGRKAKPEIPVVEITRGKRKAAANELSEVPQPKKGKMAETPAKNAKQKGSVAKDDKVDNTKQVTSKTRGTRSKAAEEPAKETTPGRGKKAAAPKEKVVEPTRGKRKAKVDPSPAKAAKKLATSASPAPRARRAARAQPATEVATKGARGRRR